MSENRDKWLFTKIGIMILLVCYVITGTSNLIVNNQRIEELSPKLVVFGEVREMDYWNITIEDDYYNMINSFGDKKNITIHFYNLTIFNFIVFSNVIYGFEYGIVKAYNIQIKSIIVIYDIGGSFIEIDVYNK